MEHSDPFIRLEHDHSHLSGLVGALREAVATAERTKTLSAEAHGEMLETLRVLRDDLFHHFAREEEGLFPVVAQEIPDLEVEINAVVESHDRICGAVSRMAHLLESAAQLPGERGSSGGRGLEGQLEILVGLFARFDEAYASHSQKELSLLHAMDGRLPPAQRAAVAKILREI